MTIDEAVMRELATGPKTLTHLQRKCVPEPRWPDTRPKDIVGILAWMEAEGRIAVQEWVCEKGRFVPIYRMVRKE
jgi:hypothetical protein